MYTRSVEACVGNDGLEVLALAYLLDPVRFQLDGEDPVILMYENGISIL